MEEWGEQSHCMLEDLDVRLGTTCNLVVLNWGRLCPPEYIWQYLKRFLMVTTMGKGGRGECQWYLVDAGQGTAKHAAMHETSATKNYSGLKCKQWSYGWGTLRSDLVLSQNCRTNQDELHQDGENPEEVMSTLGSLPEGHFFVWSWTPS